MARSGRPIDSFRQTARRLRARTTEPEDRLWRSLRRFKMSGSHFRRQVPIGPYVADFACLAARLVIEVDGSQHGSTARTARDVERTRWLEAEGYRVLRFWNNDVVRDINGVLTAIYAALYGSLDSEPLSLRHERHRIETNSDHPTPTRRVNPARRPSPSRGG